IKVPMQNRLRRVFRMACLLFFCLTTALAFGQERFTISGTLEDASNGESLIGASISVEELGTGTTTNEYGFYSMTIPKGNYTLNFSYLGYETIKKEIVLDQDLKFNLELNV